MILTFGLLIPQMGHAVRFLHGDNFPIYDWLFYLYCGKTVKMVFDFTIAADHLALASARRT